MIDLSDLNIPDVVIIVQQGNIIVTSAKLDVLDDVRTLPCPIKVLHNDLNTIIFSCHATVDCLLLAEKLATTWEGLGYKIGRVYTSDYAYNRRPVKLFTLVQKDISNKVFKLTIIKEWHPHFAQVVIAKDEQEARQLAYTQSNNCSIWLSEEESLVEEIDLNKSQVIDLGIIGAAVG